MKTLITTFFFLVALNSFAGSHEVIQIANDIDTNLVTISVNDVDGKFISIRKVETTSDNKVIDESTFDLSQLGKWPTVETKKNHDVVNIGFNENFDPVYGGTFILKYLVNGITGSRESIELNLGKNGSQWEVTFEKQIANQLLVVGNKSRIAGLIGISKIKIIK